MCVVETNTTSMSVVVYLVFGVGVSTPQILGLYIEQKLFSQILYMYR